MANYYKIPAPNPNADLLGGPNIFDFGGQPFGLSGVPNLLGAYQNRPRRQTTPQMPPDMRGNMMPQMQQPQSASDRIMAILGAQTKSPASPNLQYQADMATAASYAPRRDASGSLRDRGGFLAPSDYAGPSAEEIGLMRDFGVGLSALRNQRGLIDRAAAAGKKGYNEFQQFKQREAMGPVFNQAADALGERAAKGMEERLARTGSYFPQDTRTPMDRAAEYARSQGFQVFGRLPEGARPNTVNLETRWHQNPDQGPQFTDQELLEADTGMLGKERSDLIYGLLNKVTDAEMVPSVQADGLGLTPQGQFSWERKNYYDAVMRTLNGEGGGGQELIDRFGNDASVADMVRKFAPGVDAYRKRRSELGKRRVNPWVRM